MTTYYELRDTIQTGDILGVKARDGISIFIRTMTGESLNHVAVFVWLEDGLWIAEMNSQTDFTMVPASTYIANKTGSLFLLKMPTADTQAMKEEVLRTRALKKVDYSFPTLVKVWWAQLTQTSNNRRIGPICSTFAQRVRKAGGHDLTSLPMDPGDFIHAAVNIIPLMKDDDPYAAV
jgi:hypothetical protein